MYYLHRDKLFFFFCKCFSEDWKSNYSMIIIMMFMMTTMMARIINFVLEWQHLTECTFLSNLSDSGLLFYGGEDLGSFAG